jgi:hypothetical protein
MDDDELEAKFMVSMASMFVLSEYWSSERDGHSSGKLRVRGVQIRSVLISRFQ